MQIVEQDITTVTKGVVCHQVNCLGYMGCGVALAIRNKWPQAYLRYRSYGKKTGNGTLKPGMIQIIKVGEGLWVANLAGQDSIGRQRRMTDYPALDTCLHKLANTLINYPEIPVYFPYGMGCHNAGANWSIVEKIIVKYFPNAIFCKGIQD